MSNRVSRVNFAWMSRAKSCIVQQETQRASSELIDSSITASAKAELESGRAQLSAAERRRYANAAAYLRRRCGTKIVLAEPLSVEDVLALELARIALGGDLERVDQIIDEIDEMIRARLRPH